MMLQSDSVGSCSEVLSLMRGNIVVFEDCIVSADRERAIVQD